MAHKIDDIGLPVDPELRRLEHLLGKLATNWRGSWKDPIKSEQLIKEYHETMLQLYALGWDADLHPEAQLPDEFMPEEWFEHNPEYRE